ncbi:hypothetical protein CO731_04852 [Aminobacter sp. MSH1]|uniref:hypothetical protein n=1 Tax=Aminobacter sp. MSH1 TaxID=374606 RepID=UPI000D3B4392|nr:hypothetical protein [Aminobacter sp. MSH1]AWC25357.1 hypothetical protein CO731_04852 [Aminobacter sp. MSH1]
MIYCGVIGDGGPLTFTYLGTTTSANTGSSSITASFDLGTTHANRSIVVVPHWAGGVNVANLTSGTINGETAAVRGSEALSDGVAQHVGVGIMDALVPTGGVSNIVMGFSGTVVTVRIDVYMTTQSYSVAQYLDAGFATAVSPLLLGVDIDVSEGGTVIAGMSSSQDNNNVTWVGVTEQNDQNGGVGRYSGAFISGLGVQVNRTVSASQVIADSEGMVLAAISLVKAP